jgi:general secretion pathway protein D
VPQEQQDADPLWHTLSEEVELTALLDVCAAAFDLPLEYDRAMVQGQVTIRSGPGITNEAFWGLTNRLLLEHDLACIQAAGEDTLGVVPLAEASKMARVESGSLADARAGYVKVFTTLHQADVESVAEVLVHVLSSEGSLIQAIPSSNQILLAGLKPQVEEALETLARLDVAFASVVVEEILVENLAPTTLVALLERIAQAVSKVTQRPLVGVAMADPDTNVVIVVAPEEEIPYWRDQVTRFDRAQPTMTMEYAPRRFGLKETAGLIESVVGGTGGEKSAGWRKVTDELTGPLVLTASPRQHEEVRELLGRLESTPADANRTMRAFPIKNRDVDELLELLQGLLEGRAVPNVLPELASSEAVYSNATGAPVVRPDEIEVTLTKDEGTNRILGVGPPRMLEEIGRLIETLDVRHPQVLVEVLIVALNESETRDMAIELQKLGTWNNAFYRLATLFDAGAPDPLGVGLPAAAGTGLESVLLDPGSFSGVLRALETVNEGRALNVPKVLVNNNQTATLDSVLQAPFASVNASNTVATTAFEGTFDAGTAVTITPQITDGDQLLVEYTVSLSSFVGESADPSLPPPRQQNQLHSIATLPDGYAVVVGGLDMETEAEAESRVPFLGSLPIIGNLFKSRSVSKTKTRFFVFIRCSVFRHAGFEDLRFASSDDLDVAGLGDGWPEVEPRVIR